MKQLAALKGRRLGCFCKPQACHGDTLARAAEWAFNTLYIEGQIVERGDEDWDRRYGSGSDPMQYAMDWDVLKDEGLC